MIRLADAPAAIATGHGSVWVALQRGGSVLRIDERTEAVTTIPVGGPVTTLAVDRNAVWGTILTRAEVLRIDPFRDTVVARIPTGATPTGRAVSSRGVWVGAT